MFKCVNILDIILAGQLVHNRCKQIEPAGIAGRISGFVDMIWIDVTLPMAGFETTLPDNFDKHTLDKMAI